MAGGRNLRCARATPRSPTRATEPFSPARMAFWRASQRRYPRQRSAPSPSAGPRRPQRRRILATAGPASLGGRENRVLAGRLREVPLPLRTQGRTIPRLRRHSRSPSPDETGGPSGNSGTPTTPPTPRSSAASSIWQPWCGRRCPKPTRSWSSVPGWLTSPKCSGHSTRSPAGTHPAHLHRRAGRPHRRRDRRR